MSELPLEIDVQSVSALRTEQADFLLLDVREEDEFAVASIDGSLLLPMSQIQSRIGELEPHQDRHVVVHCHHGMRSLRVTEALRANGFPKTQSMAGGIDHWSLEIDPSVPRY